MRKIPMRLRGTNFCTSSAGFPPSFVMQPNGPECTQIVRNAKKCHFRVRWGVSGAFVAKNSDATSWHKLLHNFGRFAPSFVRQPNGTKCTQVVQNATKCQFRVRWGVSGAFVAKNSDATSCHELLPKFGQFCTEFGKATKRSRMHPIVRNAPKRQFRVQWGGSGAFVAKNSHVTLWHELLHKFGQFCTEFGKATKRSRMHPKSTKRTKTSV